MSSGFAILRKDIHRILNWEKVPNPQTVGGYQLSKDKTLFPIFVTYKKAKNIPETTNYDDHFISKTEFAWMSKRKRTIKSPEIKWLLEHNDNCRIPLFVKKSDNEGKDYNYIGELIPDKKSIVPDTIGDDPVIKVNFFINPPVKHDLYQYLIG